MAASNNFKRFEEGQAVLIERGRNKGTRGVVVQFDEETGRVGIEKENGTVAWAANGTVNWDRGQAYDPSAFEVEAPAVEPAFSEYARDPEVIEEQEGTLEITDTEEGILVEAKVPAKSTKKEPKPCQCHCGELANPGRMFLPGHDQRHKGNLIRAMQGGSEQAEAELRLRKWRTENEILQLKTKTAGSREVTESDLEAAMELLPA